METNLENLSNLFKFKMTKTAGQPEDLIERSRLLQEKIDDGIATKLLEGGIERRDTIVVNDDLSISVSKAERI